MRRGTYGSRRLLFGEIVRALNFCQLRLEGSCPLELCDRLLGPLGLRLAQSVNIVSVSFREYE